MTIAETLLPKLNEWESAGPGRQCWAQPIADSGWALNLTADRVDSLGCLLWELTLTRLNAAPVANAVLRQQAQEAADRVTGLMEPLRVVEFDELRGEALLRSDTPAQRSASLAYYEALLSGGRQIVLRRFQRSPNKDRREQIAFALTHEAIAKLVDDLIRE
jgi:hypothetical protein